MYAIGVLSDKQFQLVNEQEKLFSQFDITTYDLEKNELTDMQGIILRKNNNIQIEKLFQWLIKIREHSLKPIWILTSEPLGNEKLIYLKLGVTGFLLESDPFEEIAWTIKNSLTTLKTEKTIENQQSFQLDSSSFTVLIDGKKISLTKLEFMLLDYLYISENKVRTYEEIAGYLWGDKEKAPKYRVANLIFHIRKKLDITGINYANIVKTIRSKGYMLILSEEQTD